MMFTFAVVDSFVDAHAPISILIALIAFSQLMFNLSRLPFKYIPSNLKGSVSQVIFVALLISGESLALPNRAYLVLETLVSRPDNSLKLSRIFRISRSWVWGLQNFRNMLMSSAYASINFLWFWAEVHGEILFEWDSFRSSNSMQIMNKYPAIGSPCLHPLPTLILGVGKPLIRMEDWKFLRRELIQWMYLGLRPKNFRVFSMNLKEMLSKALEKSICSMSPGRLLFLAC